MCMYLARAAHSIIRRALLHPRARLLSASRWSEANARKFNSDIESYSRIYLIDIRRTNRTHITYINCEMYGNLEANCLSCKHSRRGCTDAAPCCCSCTIRDVVRVSSIGGSARTVVGCILLSNFAPIHTLPVTQSR